MREAFELSLDRDGIVQVVMDNEATVGNQWVAPSNALLREERADAQARRRAREGAAQGSRRRQPELHAGHADHRRTRSGIALVVQAMAQARPASTSRSSRPSSRPRSNMADKGEFEAYVLAWSGRADPDGNLYSFDACKQPLNYAGYCKPEVDELLNAVAQRSATPPSARRSTSRSRRACSRTGRSSTSTTATGCGPTPPS